MQFVNIKLRFVIFIYLNSQLFVQAKNNLQYHHAKRWTESIFLLHVSSDIRWNFHNILCDLKAEHFE